MVACAVDVIRMNPGGVLVGVAAAWCVHGLRCVQVGTP